MRKQNLLPRIALRVAALALGAAFVAAPAWAQNSGRNVNDGGMPAEPAVTATATKGTATKPSKVVSQQPTFSGRNPDDGGMPPEPTAAAKAAAPSQSASRQKTLSAPSGRNPNDGGQLTEQ
jgi:hypothetical protein